MNSHWKIIFKSITLGFKLLWKNIFYIAIFSLITTSILIAIYFPISDYLMTKGVTSWDDEFYYVSENLYFFYMSDFYILGSVQSNLYPLFYHQIPLLIVFLTITNFVVGFFFFGGILGNFKQSLLKISKKRMRHVIIERIYFKEFLSNGIRNIPFLFLLCIIVAVLCFIFTKYSNYVEDLLSRMDCEWSVIVTLRAIAAIYLFFISFFLRYVRIAVVFNRDCEGRTCFNTMKDLKKGFRSAYKFYNSNERFIKILFLFVIVGIVSALWLAGNFYLYEAEFKFPRNNFLRTLWLFVFGFGTCYFFFAQYAVAAVFYYPLSQDE